MRIKTETQIPTNEVEDRGSFALYDEEGNELDTANMTSGELEFSLGSKSVLIQRDGTEYLTVRFNANDITQSSETNKQLYLRVDSTPDETNAVNGVEAQTAATSADLTSDFVLLDSADQDSDLNYVVLDSNMTIAHSSNQESLQSTSTNNDPLYYFTVSADSNGDVELSQITIKISTTGAKLDTSQEFKLFRENANNDTELASVADSDGTNIGNTDTGATLVFSIPEGKAEIGAGETEEYYVAGIVSVTSTDSEAINYSIEEDTTYNPAGTSTSLASGNNIVWSDGSAKGNDGDDFVNGYLITVPQSSLSIR